jgi:hypothetical protein
MKATKANLNDSAHSSKLNNQKRAKQLKQFLKILNELNQDVYICVQDKKAGTVHHFSTDINKFGNFHIAAATKDVTLQKIELLNSQVAKMHDRMIAEEQEGFKISSADSKKDTEASSSGPKSEYSKTTPFGAHDGSDSDQKITELDLSAKFEIFDQKSHFELGDHRLQSLLQPDLLSQIEIPNEMSYPGQKHSSNLFSINQVSSNYPHDLDSDVGKHDEAFEDNFVQGLACAKKHPEEDVGLRVDSHKRRSFAHRALFRSESKIITQDQGYGSEEDCYSESGEFEQGYSHESSLNYSSFG